ncbi:MAG TPA: hypothetical protein PLP33_24925 [Leptospiraceae bacterium]|nr:hypothetical protein [Leptospiraceae bacterium]
MNNKLTPSEEELVLLILKNKSLPRSEIRELLNAATEEKTMTLTLTLEILNFRGLVIELESFPPIYQITKEGRESLIIAENIRVKAEGR